MNKQAIEYAMMFLNRTDLKGSEVPMFNMLMIELEKDYHSDKPEDTTKQTKLPVAEDYQEDENTDYEEEDEEEPEEEEIKQKDINAEKEKVKKMLKEIEEI